MRKVWEIYKVAGTKWGLNESLLYTRRVSCGFWFLYFAEMLYGESEGEQRARRPATCVPRWWAANVCARARPEQRETKRTRAHGRELYRGSRIYSGAGDETHAGSSSSKTALETQNDARSRTTLRCGTGGSTELCKQRIMLQWLKLGRSSYMSYMCPHY